MTSKSPVRSCEDVDETTLSYAEVKALCAGNPLIKEKIDLDVSVAKLKALKANHVNEQYRLEDNVLKFFPENIKRTEGRIKGFEADIAHLKTVPVPVEGISPMTVMGTEHTEKEQAGKAIVEACHESLEKRCTLDVGSYKGFDMSVYFDTSTFGERGQYKLDLKRDMTYTLSLGDDVYGGETRIINRINNLLVGIQKTLEGNQSQLENLEKQLANAKGELGIPFSHEDELNTKIARLAELNIQLNIEGKKEVSKPDIAADKPPAVIDKIADRIADKPPKSIYAKMEYYKNKENPPKETDGRNPKSRNNTELQ